MLRDPQELERKLLLDLHQTRRNIDAMKAQRQQCFDQAALLTEQIQKAEAACQSIESHIVPDEKPLDPVPVEPTDHKAD